MEGRDDFVRITNREIYDAIVSLKAEVTGMAANVETVQSSNIDLRKRVRVLELRTYAALSGVVTMLPVLARMAGVI